MQKKRGVRPDVPHSQRSENEEPANELKNEQPELSEENQEHVVSQKPSEGSVLKGSMCHKLLLDQVA